MLRGLGERLRASPRPPAKASFTAAQRPGAARGSDTFPQPLSAGAGSPWQARKEALSPRSRALLPRGLPPRPSNPSRLRAGTPRAAPSSLPLLPIPLRGVPGFSSLFSLTRLSISEMAALGALSRSGEAEAGPLFYRNRRRFEPISEGGGQTFITGPPPTEDKAGFRRALWVLNYLCNTGHSLVI